MKWLVFVLLVRSVVGPPYINPDENRDINDPNLFEGDMILTPEQRGNIEMGLDVFKTDRQGAAIRGRLWPSGVVLYDISPELAQNPRAMAAINAGKDEWTRKTCIRFRKRTNEAAYINFVPGNGCSSFVRRTGARQDITLAPGCWSRGIVAHEIGHAVGFFHEQSRPDRDQFVTILFANILPGKENNFRKYDRSLIDSLGTPYDYRSVMHYGDKAFSKNGLPTILVKQPGFQSVIGQRNGLSAIDAQQANLLYNCVPIRISGTTPFPGTTADPQT